MGFPSQGMPPAMGVLVRGGEQLLHWDQLQFVASFTLLSQTLFQSNGPFVGLKEVLQYRNCSPYQTQWVLHVRSASGGECRGQDTRVPSQGQTQGVHGLHS